MERLSAAKKRSPLCYTHLVPVWLQIALSLTILAAAYFVVTWINKRN